MVLDGDLDLYTTYTNPGTDKQVNEYSSGGYMSDSFINGKIHTGSQQ
jgi:hypothetical protein